MSYHVLSYNLINSYLSLLLHVSFAAKNLPVFYIVICYWRSHQFIIAELQNYNNSCGYIKINVTGSRFRRNS